MSEFIDWLPPGVGSPVRQASLFSLSLSLSVALLTRPPLPPSSTSNAATSFHPRKRAKLPQVLYLLCLATLVSTHKHDSLSLSRSLVVLILSAVSVPRRLLPPTSREDPRVRTRLGVQNSERTVGIVYRGIYPTLLSIPQPLLIYLLNNTTSLVLLGLVPFIPRPLYLSLLAFPSLSLSFFLALGRSFSLSVSLLLTLSRSRSRSFSLALALGLGFSRSFSLSLSVTLVGDGPLLFRLRRRFAFRLSGGGGECRSRRTNERTRFSDYGK